MCKSTPQPVSAICTCRGAVCTCAGVHTCAGVPMHTHHLPHPATTFRTCPHLQILRALRNPDVSEDSLPFQLRPTLESCDVCYDQWLHQGVQEQMNESPRVKDTSSGRQLSVQRCRQAASPSNKGHSSLLAHSWCCH